MLSQFIRETDEELEAYNRDIIETFIDKIYLFDDKLIITYNITNENSELDSSELSFLYGLCSNEDAFTCSHLEHSNGENEFKSEPSTKLWAMLLGSSSGVNPSISSLTST